MEKNKQILLFLAFQETIQPVYSFFCDYIQRTYMQVPWYTSNSKTLDDTSDIAKQKQPHVHIPLMWTYPHNTLKLMLKSSDFNVLERINTFLCVGQRNVHIDFLL